MNPGRSDRHIAAGVIELIDCNASAGGGMECSGSLPDRKKWCGQWCDQANSDGKVR